MKKLFMLLFSAGAFIQSHDYTVDLINKSQFPVNVKISNTSTYIPSKAPKQYTTIWDLKPGVTKANQVLGWKDQFTYKYLILNFGVNYGGVNQGFGVYEIVNIPKKYQNTNDFIATIDIQKKTGKEATDYINKLLKNQFPYSTQIENIYLKKQKEQDWAWVPSVTFTPKN